jgi:hypothetical protein
MLAAVERGTLKSSLPCSPSHVFYVALPHHVSRDAGAVFIQGMKGPTYIRNSSEGVTYVGTEAPEAPSPPTSHDDLRARLGAQVEKSRVYQALKFVPTESSDANATLYFSIVRQAFDSFAKIWPRAERHVIAWGIHPFYAGGLERFHEGLRTADATIHFIDDILPNASEDPERYGLHRSDLHPNEVAHAAVADYIVMNVLKFEAPEL